jgi:hypothetical protein
MSLGHGVLITRTNLKMLLDPANAKSYPGSGSAITDITRNGFNGTLQNSPTFSTTNGGILTFNGTNQYVQGSGFPIVPGTVYTKNVWFNLAATADNNLISSDNGGHFMYFSGSSKMYCGHTDWGNYQAYQSTASFSNGVWYNACLTFSTTNGFSLYINGVLDSTYTALKTAVPGNGNVNLGSFGDAGGNYLNGSIGYAAVYSGELSATEVAQNFNALRGRFGI